MYFPFTEHSSLANGLGPFVEGSLLKGRFTVCIWGAIEGAALKGTDLSSIQGALGERPKFSFIVGQIRLLLPGLEGFVCCFALLFLLYIKEDLEAAYPFGPFGPIWPLNN